MSTITREELISLANAARYAAAVDDIKATVRNAAIVGQTTVTASVVPPAINSSEEFAAFLVELRKAFASPIQVTSPSVGVVTVDWS